MFVYQGGEVFLLVTMVFALGFTCGGMFTEWRRKRAERARMRDHVRRDSARWL